MVSKILDNFPIHFFFLFMLLCPFLKLCLKFIWSDFLRRSFQHMQKIQSLPQREYKEIYLKPSVRDCFHQYSLTVERHHNHSNFYKEKYLTGTCLWFQKFSPLSLGQEAWEHAADVVLERELEGSASRPEGSGKRETWSGLGSETPKPTLSDKLPPLRPQLLIPFN